VLPVALLDYSLLLLFLDALLVLLASLFFLYLTVVCAVAVVVSAAEPGRRGAGAVSRAWRLMQGRAAQAALYVVATCALGAAVSPMYTLALSWWPRSAPSGVAAGVAYVLMASASSSRAAASGCTARALPRSSAAARAAVRTRSGAKSAPFWAGRTTPCFRKVKKPGD
jgi:hypothetical protein